MNGFVARTLSIVVLTCLLPALNELDGIAAAFAFGMADEKIGFTATGLYLLSNRCVVIRYTLHRSLG